MFGLNAILYSDKEIEARKGTSSIGGEGNSILTDLPKSSICFLITLGISFLLGLIIIVPDKYEKDLFRVFKTSNKILISAM